MSLLYEVTLVVTVCLI